MLFETFLSTTFTLESAWVRHGHDASITGHEENIYGFSNDSQHATVPLVKDIAKYGSFGSDMDIIDCQRYAEKLVTAAFELCQHYDRAQRAFINKDPILHPYLLKELSSLENQYRHIEGVYAAVTKEYEKLSNRLVEENPDLKTAFLPLPFLSRLPDRIAFIEQNDKRMEPDPSNSETDRQEIEDSKYLTNTEEDYVSNQRHSPAASYILEHEPVRGGNNFKPSSNSHSNSTRANNGKNYDDCFSNDGNLLPHSDQTKQDERTEPLCLEEFNRFRPDVLNVVRRPLSGNVRFGSFDTVYEISPLHYPGMYSSIPFELRPCHQQSSKSSQLSPHSSSQVPIDHMIKANCQEKVDPISQKEKISRQPSRSTSIGEEKLGTIDHSKREEQQKLKKVLAAEDKQEKRETKLDETILCSRKFNLCDCVYDKKTNATSDDGDDENAASSNSSYNEENFQAHSSEHQEQSKLGLSKYLNMPTSDTLDETRLTHYNKRRSHKRRLQSISNEEGEQENGHQENNKVGDSKEADIDKRDNIHQRYLSAEGDMDDNTNSEEFSSIAISNPTKSDIIYQMRLQSEPGKAQVTGKDQNFDSTNNDGSGTDDGNDAHDSDSFKSDGTNYNGEEDFQDLKHPAKDQLFCSRQNAQPLVKKSFVRVNKHMNENVTSHKQHDVARSHFNHRAKSIERLNESRKSLQQVVRESQERSLLTAASLRPRSYENRGIDYPCYYRDYSNFDMSFDFKRSIFKDLVNERSFNGSWNDQPRSTVPKPFLLNEHRLHKNPSSSPSLGLSFHDSTESPMARNEDEKAEMRVGRKQQAENEEKDDKLCTDRQADFVTSTPTEHKRQRKFSQAKSTKFITFDSIIAADSVKSSHQCEHSISPAPNGDRYLRASSRSSSSDSFRCYDSSQNRNSQDDSQGDTLSQKNEILFQHGKASAQPSSGDNIQLGSGNTPNDMRNYATKSKLKKPSTEDNSEQSELSASESLIFQSHLFSNHDSQDEDDVTCDPFYNLSQSLDRATDAARKLNLSASQLSTASVD
eukprot:gene7629-579_t